MYAFRRFLAPGVASCAIALVAGAQDQPLVFKSKVNLIMVPVVVRDQKGRLVSTLHKDDFELFDQGKLQVISSFSVERSGGKTLPAIPMAGRAPVLQRGQPPVTAPDRFIGIFIDDVNSAFEDLAYTRSKLKKFIDTRLQAGDRAAIFTTSGQTFLDFTDDRDKLNATALKITPHPPALPPPICQPMTILEADRIANMADKDLLTGRAGKDVEVGCARDLPSGMTIEMGGAKSIMAVVQISVRNAVARMASVVRAMGEKPGQRILILASAGFLSPSSERQEDAAVIDQAIRSRVIINTLDARGLVGKKIPLEQQMRQSEILAGLADGTGGKFIHNTNDIEGGFAELAEAPEVTYLLGFSPESLNPDGKFHALKVKVKDERGFEVQARHGYFAPDRLVSAGENFKDEIRTAVFSQDEIHDIGIDMTTELSKISDSETKLTIVSNIDVTKLHYRVVDGKDTNEIDVVCALFDRNGNYIEGVSNTVSLKLVDEALRNRKSATIPVRAEFKVAPGRYAIRLVARDSQGEMMTAQNGTVEVPK